MTRVGYVTPWLNGDSGWGRYSAEIIRHVALYGVEPVILVRSDSDLYGEMAGATIIKCLPPPDSLQRSYRNLAYWIRLRKLVKEVPIVHCLAEPYVPLSFLLSMGKHLVISGVGTYLVRPFATGKRSWLYRLAYRHAGAILCISRYTRSKLEEYMPHLDSLEVVKLGVDPDDFHESPLYGKKLWPGQRVVLSVGSIKERKGYEFSIPAFAQVLKDFPDARYVIVGRDVGGDYLEKLKQLIEDLHLNSYVSIILDADEKALLSWYHSAELFVLTPVNVGTDFEGFGLVYLEAGSCQLPVIGSSECGAEDAILDGVTGLLVEQRNVEAIAASMKLLLSSDELRNRMGLKGLEYARQHNWHNVARRTVSVYERMSDKW